MSELIDRQALYENKIYLGDCIETLKLFPSKLIDCVITSPPYNLGGDFHICNNGKRTTYGGYNSFNDKMKESDYQKNQIDVLNELYRVTKDSAYCFYIHKERIVRNNIISPIEWIRKTEWLISQTVVLDMSATANVDKRRFFPTHEYIYVLCKNKDCKLHNEHKLTSVWKVKKTPRKISGHPATFDYNIPYECILASTEEGDIVLDCYMGTGTTALACINTNRKYIGIEVDEDYVNNAKANLKKMETNQST
jgi:modification methylase